MRKGERMIDLNDIEERLKMANGDGDNKHDVAEGLVMYDVPGMIKEMKELRGVVNDLISAINAMPLFWEDFVGEKLAARARAVSSRWNDG
jgi:tetrahydromethanopterin S-methyltransferase subunit B